MRAGTGTDTFTETLASELQKRELRAEIAWLPLRAEYAPWTVPAPKPPQWATVVHVNTWLHPRFVPTSLPLVATLHHSVHHPDLEPYKGWLRSRYHRFWIRRVERAIMRRADRVVAVSRFAADTGRATLLERPIDVIENGVDTARFCPPPERPSGHPFRLLYVGSWMARKGVDLLAPIMQELGAGFELHFTGGAAARDGGAEAPANMHNIGRLNGKEAVVTAMQGADAFLFPSRGEGLPLSVLEAMACGLPVIAADGPSLVHVVDDGVTGILCPQDDVAAFAGAARKLAFEPALAARMSSGARQRVLSRFSIDRMVDEYRAIYEACIDGTGRRAGTASQPPG